MSRNISVRGIRREPVDLSRLAAALAALAAEQRRREAGEKPSSPQPDAGRKEAA